MFDFVPDFCPENIRLKYVVNTREGSICFWLMTKYIRIMRHVKMEILQSNKIEYMRKSSHLDKKSRQYNILAAKMKMKG